MIQQWRILALSMSLAAGSAVAQPPDPPDAPPTGDFATMKAQQVERLTKELACVQAATSLAALRDCRPPPPGHGGRPPG